MLVLKMLRIWVGATALAVLVTSGGIAATQAYTPPKSSPFTDVSTGHTFYKQISWLASEGISTGYGNAPRRTFQPAAPVLREQMAAFLYRLADEPSYSPPARSPFTDVSTRHTFYKQISWLASTGISTGYDLPGGRKEFRPAQPVLREQMAAFLFRYEQVGTPMLIPSSFGDVPAAHAFARQITWLSQRGISTGYGEQPNRTFRPSQPVLREQMAAFMYRVDDVDGLRTPSITVPDRLTLTLGEPMVQELQDPRERDWSDINRQAWTLISGSLPPGLVLVNRSPLVAEQSTLEGTPHTIGTFTATLRYRTPMGDKADRTITIVVPDPTLPVDPSGAATRSDLAVSFHDCLEPTVDLPDQSPFSDVPRDDPRFEAVYWAHVSGHIPSAGGRARPDETLTRGVAATFMARVAWPGYEPTAGQQSFDDVPLTHPDYVGIDWAGATNAIVAAAPRVFMPDKLLAKADMERYRWVFRPGTACVGDTILE